MMLRTGILAVVLLSCVHLLLLSSCTDTPSTTGPVIRLDSSGRVTITIKATDEQKARLEQPGFALFLLDHGKPVSYPVACRSGIKGDSIVIEPVFELVRGLSFEFQLYNGTDTLRTRFNTLPLEKGSEVTVQHIFPLQEKVPSNILMFHVVFSAPMQQDITAFRKVFIYDEQGRQKDLVWREKSNWTEDGRHLVLMIHPGRIKRGIHYHDKDEPLFETGKRYRLVVSRSLVDIYNRPMRKDGVKTFEVTAADGDIPVFNHAKSHEIKSNSKTPFTFHFSEVMDYGSMQIGFHLTGPNKEKITGTIAPANDKSWSFTPDSLWKPGPYQLELNDYVTDLAGNHLVRKFEETLEEAINKRHSLYFSINTKKPLKH